jgi:hypothetical protein
MELCTPIWLNHDYGDGGVVDISVVDAHSGVEVSYPSSKKQNQSLYTCAQDV